MENSTILIDEETINIRIKELANELYKVYNNEEVIFVCTLKGAVFFTCELLKRYPGNAKLEFVRISSYEGKETTSKVELKVPIAKELIENKRVIILEDIVDTGYSLEFLYKYLGEMKPKSLESCVLLNKQERRKVPVQATYVGFEIEDLFVVGYGLDYNQAYRNIPNITVLKK